MQVVFTMFPVFCLVIILKYCTFYRFVTDWSHDVVFQNVAVFSLSSYLYFIYLFHLCFHHIFIPSVRRPLPDCSHDAVCLCVFIISLFHLCFHHIFIPSVCRPVPDCSHDAVPGRLGIATRPAALWIRSGPLYPRWMLTRFVLTYYRIYTPGIKLMTVT